MGNVIVNIYLDAQQEEIYKEYGQEFRMKVKLYLKRIIKRRIQAHKRANGGI